MATPQENAAAIVAQAAALDTLIASFRAIKADIDAREVEIRMAFLGRGFFNAGQQRLAHYAHSLMVNPSNEGRLSAEAMASAAWAEFL